MIRMRAGVAKMVAGLGAFMRERFKQTFHDGLFPELVFANGGCAGSLQVPIYCGGTRDAE